MEEDQKSNIAIGIILRIPGVILLELLYMEAVSLKNVIFLKENFHTAENIDVFLYILAWFLILMPVRILRIIYCHAIAAFCIAASHYILHHWLVTRNILVPDVFYAQPYTSKVGNSSWVNSACKHDAMDGCVSIILVQSTLVLLSCWMIKSKGTILIVYLSPLLPWLAGLYSSTDLVAILQISQLLSGIFAVLYVVNRIGKILLHFKMMWYRFRLLLTLFGWHGIITWAQDEYQVQLLLVSCWVLRYVVQLVANLQQNISLGTLDQTLFENLNVDVTELPSIISLLFFLFLTGVQCLTTTVNLFGLACIVKDVVRLQYFLIRSWLHWSLTDHPPDSVTGPLTGAIDGVTLLIMTLYTDTLNFDVEGRFVLLVYIMCTIASSQFQSLFSIVDPILMTLATAHNGSLWKHLRTVLIALLLLIISGVLSYVSLFTMSSTFWVFIVAYNYVNTFSLILGSLAIYCILMIDYLTLRGWNSLDDVMFYIRGACRAVEFLVTLCMCGYIMMTFYTEMSSVAGIVMLAVYTYYCIVQRGGKGWKIWMMRRQASNKVESLPFATAADLTAKEDLCPICYQAMVSDARIMHCGHLFHGNCLKKWFYIQDKCPMCYAEFRRNPKMEEAKATGDASDCRNKTSDDVATQQSPTT